jgi:hypothetical protein
VIGDAVGKPKERTCGFRFRRCPKHTYSVTSRDFVVEEITLGEAFAGYEYSAVSPFVGSSDS